MAEAEDPGFRDAAALEAERQLAHRTQFALEAERWPELLEMLDRPLRENAGLAKLFSKPSAFSPS
jgi:uncharacterized protein (DUF1778 family)